MNRGKTGEPFHYPETFVLMLGYAKVSFHPPYRQKQKVSSKDMQVIEFHPFLISVPINRRINRLNVKIKYDNNKNINLDNEYIIISVETVQVSR